MNVIPDFGEHCLVVGQTGSGKTLFGRWLVLHMPGAVIYDTKGEPAFDGLGPVVETVDQVWEALAQDDTDFVVCRPPPEVLADPMVMDDYLGAHYEIGHGTTAYLDEGYQWHIRGQAGPGYLGLLTRGRSRDINVITCTQRPAWLSRFALTESKRFYLFRVQDFRDRARLGEVIPGYEKRTVPPPFYWDYCDARAEKITRMAPVDIDYRPPSANAVGDSPADEPLPVSQYFNWL